ncbi:hypothetical protein B0T14DRAFT_271797 [Immersiella caudata]|uniref:Uncharacterized protein n=1 Tax=Immersiella caudata TaxID=314043 RepID=A0AA39WLB5_9PEZI|nr:hypothetical protein B0T14DRAFT_271797 [Immersiella caudata]
MLIRLQVLISYYIQGILLLLAAAVVAVLASRSWLRGGQGSIESSVVRKLESPMATFLTAETYFSISTAIAAFIMSPRAIDPLNGYALMVVAIVGFLCPVFTLLLLRCLTEARVTRFGTVLTVVSWFLNTVLFFLLLPNLSTFGDDVAEDALKQLFSIPTCGDSSAMSLCQQLTGNNPLRSLTGFFERSSWTNIRTVPMVWTFATAILIVLVSEKVCRMAVGFRCRERPARGKEQETVYSRLGETRQERSSSQDPHSHRTGRLIVSVVFIVLCSVCLGYTFHMVVRFRGIDAIDIQGWSFGQVVAAIFWVPVFLDVAHSIFTSDAALST